jgi:hypothetical protein
MYLRAGKAFSRVRRWSRRDSLETRSQPLPPKPETPPLDVEVLADLVADRILSRMENRPVSPDVVSSRSAKQFVKMVEDGDSSLATTTDAKVVPSSSETTIDAGATEELAKLLSSEGE